MEKFGEVIDNLIANQINNFAFATFPIPVTPAPGNGGSNSTPAQSLLANTGQNQELLLVAAGALLVSSLTMFGIAARRRKKLVHYSLL